MPVDPGAGPPAPAHPTRRRRPFLLAGLIGAAALVVAAVVAISVRGPGGAQAAAVTTLRPSGIPASVSTNLAMLMGLSPVPAQKAPAFVLTDQQGRVRSLADFRGRVVVLEAMDPHCTDICPLVSDELVDAYHDLGPLADRVVFAALNVNQYNEGVSAVATFSREHQLDTIPSWHFLTGSTATLKAAWSAYNIQVQAPSPTADIVHSAVMYFIDPHGVEQYIASPMVDHTKAGVAYLPGSQLTAWGHGIALVAADLAHGAA